jgi:hypothetical protein
MLNSYRLPTMNTEIFTFVFARSNLVTDECCNTKIAVPSLGMWPVSGHEETPLTGGTDVRFTATRSIEKWRRFSRFSVDLVIMYFDRPVV